MSSFTPVRAERSSGARLGFSWILALACFLWSGLGSVPLVAQEEPVAVQEEVVLEATDTESADSNDSGDSGDSDNNGSNDSDRRAGDDGADAAELLRSAQELGELRRQLEALEEDFNILTTAQGIGLTPRDESLDFSLLEVQKGVLAADGEEVDEERLFELLGRRDGERLLALAELSSAQLRALRRPINRELEERLERIAELQEQRDRELAELESLRDELSSRDETAADEEEEEGSRYYTQDRFSFGNSLTIDERESTNDVVVIGGSLEVDGEVLSDAVVIGGGVEVQGSIHGDLTAVGGSISIGPDAEINGDVTSVGGTIDDPYNRVRGGAVQVDLGPLKGVDGVFFDDDDWRDDHWDSGSSFGWGLGSAVLSVIGLAFFILWILLLTYLNRGYVDGLAQRTEHEPWKAALVGLVSQVLLLPLVAVISLIFVVSIIGIPLLIILLPLGALLLFIFACYGYAGVASWSGRLLQRRFDWRQIGPFTLVVVGILLIEGWAIVGEALSGIGGPIQVSAWLVLILGFLLQYLAWTTGLGSVVLTAFGREGGFLGGSGPWNRPNPPSFGPPPADTAPPRETEPGDYGVVDLPEEGYGFADTEPADALASPETWDDPFADDSGARDEDDPDDGLPSDDSDTTPDDAPSDDKSDDGEVDRQR